MDTRDIQVRRGVKTVALVAVGAVVAIVLFKMLMSFIIPLAIGVLVLWFIYRAVRTR